MKLERKVYRDGNLYPEVFNYLKFLPDNVLFHTDHAQRHPFSIYSLSLQQITQAFKAVIDEMDQATTALVDANNCLNYRLNKLPKLQEELLRSLLCHIDICYQILKTLHPPVELKKPQKFADRWLEQVKHPTYKAFQDAIKDYRESFAPIFNKVKHEGAPLRSVMVYSRNKGIIEYHPENGVKFFHRDARIVGYFLEGIQPDGCIGPDLDIHPRGNTAISLNRDLRCHFANLYRIGRHLKSAVVKAVHKIHSINLPKPSQVGPSPYQDDLEQIAERIGKLPTLFFEDEFSKITPHVQYFRGTRGGELIVEFPGLRNISWHGDVVIQVEAQVDSVSLEYRILYMNK
jgi:hypothetical protein